MLKHVQELLVRALREPDPRGCVQNALAHDATFSAEERAWLAALPDDGLRLTRFLVRKLRLQRLLLGDAGLAALCASDPAELARLFAAYDAAVPPTAIFPSEEAAAFAAWRAARDG